MEPEVRVRRPSWAMINFLKRIWRWIRTDGQLHSGACALIVFSFGWIRPWWVSAVIALAVAVGKEIYDKVTGRGTAEWHDVICDIAGILYGLAVLLLYYLVF